ncbi:pantoate--beta-alanine ligase [Granulicella arctica]|uniref:Pantothenate synthetase n=1 Tax=Granulicella arctica TaxID=940613 RepID=A0A7Y9TFT5_9BACT|nr:pantoate--beta-alanine ligase [Granulicella arctica]NYF78699.1 pantoate--beta-alanine ligase [Granulicella arctica]
MHIAHTIAELRQHRHVLLNNTDTAPLDSFASEHTPGCPILRDSAKGGTQSSPQSRNTDATLGLVPTMGALHEGHRSLLQRASRECAVTAATIFVNPLQFAPTEDLSRYPRTFEADVAMLQAEGIDLLFAPTPEEMYPDGAVTTIHVNGIEDRLDGASRPGHFCGVATVVAKLFHIVQPHRAYFGQKDAAQLAVLRQMTRDLNFDLDLIACPTVRDPDGLALSSRNRYLSAEERTRALTLSRTLQLIYTRIAEGQRNTATLLDEAHSTLAAEPNITLDYLAIVDPNTLLPIPEATPGTLIAIAAKVGTTRLIDNLLAP